MKSAPKNATGQTTPDIGDDPHDRRLILASLRLTPEERLLRLTQAHEFRAVIREARPYELRER